MFLYITFLSFVSIYFKDFLDVEMKPLVESVSVNKRDKEAIKKVWEMMYNQLLDTRSSAQSSSLYGTPSIQKGAKMKKFAQVSKGMN